VVSLLHQVLVQAPHCASVYQMGLPSRNDFREGADVRVRNCPAPDDFAKVAPGRSIKQLQRHYAAGYKTVLRWMIKSGIKPIRTCRTIPTDLAKSAKTMTGSELARHYDIPEKVMRGMLKRAGIEAAVYAGHQKQPVPDDLAARCAEMTKAELVKHYGVGNWIVNRWLIEARLTARKHIPSTVYNRPLTRYVRTPGYRNLASVKRDTSAEDLAADILRRVGPVYRCDEKGLAAERGTLWRFGNIILTGDQLLERAERRRVA
jgi:hypothetical protein